MQKCDFDLAALPFNFFKFFNRSSDTEIKWQSITKIGEDVILVKISI